MKRLKTTLLFLMVIAVTSVFAQERYENEKYGKTLNLGVGIGGYSGYYGYTGTLMPILHANYEFDVIPSLTLAPFITFYTYHRNDYREVVIPIGVKGTYYFDKIFNANPRWDFYLAGSLGFAISNTVWDNGYIGDRTNNTRGAPLFLDVHAGTEYHITGKLGAFLDLSSGVSTLGLAIHL